MKYNERLVAHGHTQYPWAYLNFLLNFLVRLEARNAAAVSDRLERELHQACRHTPRIVVLSSQDYATHSPPPSAARSVSTLNTQRSRTSFVSTPVMTTTSFCTSPFDSHAEVGNQENRASSEVLS